MDKILVLDFGSQYSHLICRRIREFSVFAELVPYDISYEEIKKHNPKGIIFSGDHLAFILPKLQYQKIKFLKWIYHY